MRSTKAVLISNMCAAAILLGSQGVQAAEDVGQVYVKALGTYISADSDRLVDDDVAGGALGFGYALSEHFNLEFDMQWLNLDGDPVGNPDQDQTAVNLNLMNIYNRSGLFAPYLLAGAGVVSTDEDGSESYDDLQLQGGAGVLTRLWGDRVSLRTEVLYRWQDASSSLSDVLVNAGFSVALGSKPVAAAPVAAVVAAPVVVAPKDSDGDGVVDSADKCPGTVAGAKVNAQGCELDGDSDGVVDRLDECPGTPAGAKVDVRGCEESLILRGVVFGNDSSKITAQSEMILDSVADILGKRTHFKHIEVRGHTDSVGADQYNQGLSQRRADAVKSYLVGKGLSADLFTTKGFGESEPIAPNDTADGREQNRRVTLEFSAKQ